MTAPTLDEQLEPWCAAGASGALRLLGPPGGVVYLVDGRIVYAECPRVCGINRLLIAGGQISTDALRANTTAAQLSDAATTHGQITHLELESLFLAALHSASFVLAGAEVSVRFQVGVRHPLTGLASVELAHLRAEIGRRRRVMHETWPDARVDSAPVTPIRRMARQRVVLTALQWEIVVNAGRRRTPLDLARRLGRDTYATLLSARQLVAAELIAAPPGQALPSPAPPAAIQASTIQASAARASAAQTSTARATGVAQPKSASSKNDAPPTATRRARTTATADAAEHGVPLPRREAIAALPDDAGESEEPPWSDIELVRIRDALQALP